MAIPIIGALLSKVGSGASAIGKFASSEKGKGIMNLLGSGSGNDVSNPGVFTVPALPKMDGGFYGHTKATSIPPTPMKGQVTKTSVVADSCMHNMKVPKGAEIKGACC